MNNEYMPWIGIGLFIMMLSSCVSSSVSKKAPQNYAVEILESPAAITEKCNTIAKNKTYFRKCSVRSKTNDKYNLIIYDKNYMSINGTIYA